MTRRKPHFCPECGTELERRELEDRERGFCPECREFVFQNPAPTAWVAVLDGQRVVFVKEDHPPDEGTWATPGGFIEVDEPASEGAARELREETGLRVDPDDLELVRTGFHIDDPDDGSLLSVSFAVEREDTTGTVQVGEEPDDVQFWDPDELAGSDTAETRTVDRRRVEAAFERLRGVDRDLDPS